MDGKEVFKFAVSKVPEAISELLEKAGKNKEDITYYILHQANLRIVSSVAKHMKEQQSLAAFVVVAVFMIFQNNTCDFWKCGNVKSFRKMQ